MSSLLRVARRRPAHGSGDVEAGVVDRGAHGRVIELLAGDGHALGAEVDVDRADARDPLELRW